MSDWIAQTVGYAYRSAASLAPERFLEHAVLHSLDAGSKRKHGLLTPPDSPTHKRFKTDSRAITKSMPRVRKFGRRRRFRKGKSFRRGGRVKRILFRAKQRRFKSAVKRVVLRTISETKKHQFNETSVNLLPGDGTTARVRVFAPWQVMFAQGTSSTQMIGSRVNLGTIFWRIHFQNLLAGDVHIQILLYKTDFQMDVTTGATLTNNEGVTMQGNTTTTTNPTQTAPNGNIPLFDTTASPGQFAGISCVTKFNPDVGRIVRKWDYKITGFGQGATDGFRDVMIKHRFNRNVQIQETADTIDGVPRFFGPANRRSYSQYYFIVRTWDISLTANVANVNMLHRAVVTYTDT